MEETIDSNLDLDLSSEEVLYKVDISEQKTKKKQRKEDIISSEDNIISCLRNERIVVRYIPKETGMVNNPKHIFYGGISENSSRIFTVPLLTNGQYVNVLTNEEKAFLEESMGLDYNALSIHLRENNFWENYSVRLTKAEFYLDLSNPNDYIKYKVLLANKDFIAGSIKILQDTPKVSYQYVLISEGEEASNASKEMSVTMQSYLEFGKVQDDINILRLIIETIDGRPTSPSSKIEFLQSQINKLIQADSKLFLRTIKDTYLPFKVLIKQAIEAKIISKRGDYLYLSQDNSPLCENNEEPTFNIAAKYLSAPKRQELKFTIEAKVKAYKEK